MKALILVFVVLFGSFVKWEEKRYHFQITNTPVDNKKIREQLRCLALLNVKIPVITKPGEAPYRKIKKK